MFLWLLNYCLSLLSSKELQLYVVTILEKLAKKTDNPVDDILVEHFKKSILETKDGTISSEKEVREGAEGDTSRAGETR